MGSTSESNYNYSQKERLTSHLLGHLDRWVDDLFSFPLSWNKIVYKGRQGRDVKTDEMRILDVYRIGRFSKGI